MYMYGCPTWYLIGYPDVQRVAHHTGYGEEDGWMACGLLV